MKQMTMNLPIAMAMLLYIIAIWASIKDIRKHKGYSLAWMLLIMAFVCLLGFVLMLLHIV